MPHPQVLFVIGSGAREHAVVRHLRQHDPHARIFCAPGNPGIERLATCLPVATADLDGLAAAAASVDADLTIIGPEAPLVGGLADRLRARGLRVLGPNAAAAAIEGSKAFAKALMARWNIPTARHASFDDPAAALAHLDRLDGPVVVKADGLAAGKGVVVCDDPGEAVRAAHAMMVGGIFGGAGRRVVIEERLDGDEVSVFALVEGDAVCLLPTAQDHKRLADGDRGPNTGGMGAAAPVALDEGLRDRVLREILRPLAAAMVAEDRPFHGVLFAGLMLTPDGPRVLEFNCRLGDPEAQVILPLLRVGLVDLQDAAAHGDAAVALAPWAGAAVGVVLASRGYPAAPQTGIPIEGLPAAERKAAVFHGATDKRDGRLVTAGGRVLTVTGLGAEVAEAQRAAYDAVAYVRFDGMHFRRDIGARLAGAAVPAGRG
jgi:phosphoribosylamine--glycine ligase